MVGPADIYQFLEEQTGIGGYVADTDINMEKGVYGDDFHELVDAYSKRFKVDMSGYLWYFIRVKKGTEVSALYFLKHRTGVFTELP